MSDSILREFVCPNCNAPLPYDPHAPKVECPACLSVFLIQTDSSDNSSTVKNVAADGAPQQEAPPLEEVAQYAPPQAERLYPFTVSLQEYRAKLYHWFGDFDYLPHDFYKEVTFVSQQAVYVPYYIITGEFKVPYTYQIRRKYGENVYWYDRSDKTSTTLDTQLYAGRLPNAWTSLLPKCEEIFQKATASGNYSDFKGIDLSGCLLLEPAMTKDEVCERHTKPLLAKQAEKAANKDASRDPHPVRRVKAGYKGTVYHTLVYLPFYVTQYQYKGTMYIHIADGTNFENSMGTRPECDDIKKGAGNAMGLANIGCSLYFLAGVVVFIIHWIVGGLSDEAWRIFWYCGIPVAIVYFFYRSRRKDYLKGERQKRMKENSIDQVNLDEFFSR